MLKSSTCCRGPRSRSRSPLPRKQIKEPDKDDFATLRDKSRQDYPRKRETDRAILLQQQVEEEAKGQRRNPHLSKRELVEIESNRHILAAIEGSIDAHNAARNRNEFTTQIAGERSQSETINAKMKDRDFSDLQL